MLMARTLAEAQVYVSVTTAADPSAPAVEPTPLVPGPDLTEGADAWTVRTPAGEISVPYAAEEAARAIGARFGLGVSPLVDAAQWALVAATYARRALEAQLAYPGGEDREDVERNWECAADAVGEAMKFLPADAAEVPDEAVWSEWGRQARERDPRLLARAKLADDLEYYRGALEDFRALHGPAT